MKLLTLYVNGFNLDITSHVHSCYKDFTAIQESLACINTKNKRFLPKILNFARNKEKVKRRNRIFRLSFYKTVRTITILNRAGKILFRF